MPAALDTLSIAKRLEEAGFSEPQAEALTTVLRDSREADFALLATRADLDSLRAEMRAEIGSLRTGIGAKLEIRRRDITIRLGSMIVVAAGVLLASKFLS